LQQDKKITMLTALLVICSAAVTPDLGHYTRKSATAEIAVPVEIANPALCLMHGQAYLAGTSFGRDLGSDDRIKIICVRTEAASASINVDEFRL
jgi:hypothetical protein